MLRDYANGASRHLCWDQVYDESSVRQIGFLPRAILWPSPAAPSAATRVERSRGIDLLFYLFFKLYLSDLF